MTAVTALRKPARGLVRLSALTARDRIISMGPGPPQGSRQREPLERGYASAGSASDANWPSRVPRIAGDVTADSALSPDL
jgi:hypothetical protein